MSRLALILALLLSAPAFAQVSREPNELPGPFEATTYRCDTYKLPRQTLSFPAARADQWIIGDLAVLGPATFEMSVVLDGTDVPVPRLFEFEIVENPGLDETNFWKRVQRLDTKLNGWMEFHPLIVTPPGVHLLSVKLQTLDSKRAGSVEMRWAVLRICH